MGCRKTKAYKEEGDAARHGVRQRRRQASECQWKAYATRKDGSWYLRMEDPEHNHPASAPEAFSANRQFLPADMAIIKDDVTEEEPIETVLNPRPERLDLLIPIDPSLDPALPNPLITATHPTPRKQEITKSKPIANTKSLIQQNHPRRIQEVFRIPLYTFLQLQIWLEENTNLKPCKYIGVPEKLVMLIKTVGRGTTSRGVQEPSQHSGDTVSRYFHEVLDAPIQMHAHYTSVQHPERPASAQL